ncbi:MAG: hypothetical protein KJ646_03575 [Nanoarchaeota archaeon]|nr:hypothetical protein [Nanoarchaeota archaeon]MBU4117028.1 hypothetical protein [Nanoarchaeota archaeon]
MAKKESRGNVLSFLAWITGVVVSLVVGNAMIQGILRLPGWLGGTTSAGMIIAATIGWIVVITTLVGAVMAILRK